MSGTVGNPATIERRAFPVMGATLEGDLSLPLDAHGIVVLPHGSGSSSLSDERLAERLRVAGLGTLVLNLLTPDEQRLDARTACFRFDSGMLGTRLVGTLDWLADETATTGLAIGCMGTSTAAAAVLSAADRRCDHLAAVVLYDGRPDLAERALARILTPTLLMVDGHDEPLFGLNRDLRQWLGGVKQIVFVPGATVVLDEPGALEEVGALAAGWFRKYFKRDKGMQEGAQKD
jgi:putative phosphoribosyl transferase